MKPYSICLVLVLGVIASVPASVAQDAAGELVLIDLRPKEEKDGFSLAELSGKCNDEVFRIPDVATDPMKVALLKADIADALADGGAGKTLTVLNWSIYYNKQVSGGGPGLSGVGIQGYSLPGKSKERRPGSKCSQKQSAGGWYLAGEVTTQYFPLISEFSGTFAGKQVSARVVYSPSRKLEGKFEGAASDSEALIDAVHRTAETLVTVIVQ
jgi:hypothetical protein